MLKIVKFYNVSYILVKIKKLFFFLFQYLKVRNHYVNSFLMIKVNFVWLFSLILFSINISTQTLMKILGATQFDRQVLNISLINICNQESYIGQEMRKHYHAWKDETDEPSQNPWLDLHQFTIYVPHPEQVYDDMTLEDGLTKGYNVEVKLVENRSKLPYNIPGGGHFVVVLKQEAVNADFGIAATGIFVRALAVLYLDIIVDIDRPEYQQIIIKHPIIKKYPTGWEEKFKMFINQEISSQDLPDLVGYVDRAFNQDYRSPSWNEIRQLNSGFAGV